MSSKQWVIMWYKDPRINLFSGDTEGEATKEALRYIQENGMSEDDRILAIMPVVTEPEAKKLIEGMGCLASSWGITAKDRTQSKDVFWDPSSTRISLNGRFTLEQIEALAWWMRRNMGCPEL